MNQRSLKYFLSLSLLMSLPSSSQAKDPVPDTIIPLSSGVAAHFNSLAYNPAYTPNTFNSVAQAGISLVRFVPDWQHIEKSKGIYDFSLVDWLTYSFTTRGIRPVLCLGLNNPIYQVNSRIKTPEQQVAFGNFVKAMVEHYRGRGIIWEIWNEPNIPAFWKPLSGEQLTLDTQVSEYLSLVNYIVPIIRQADSEALIIGPGASNYNTPWLQLALQQGLLDQLDGLSVHPYQGKERPELIIAQHKQVQSWIPINNINKPIFFTEWGYSTGIGPEEVSEQKQALYVSRQYMLSLLLNIRGNFIYSLTDASSSYPCQTKNSCYGLFRKSDGVNKPAYTALKGLTDQLVGYRVIRRIPHSDPTIYLLELKNNVGKIKYAIWCSKENSPTQVILPNNSTILANESIQVVELN